VVGEKVSTGCFFGHIAVVYNNVFEETGTWCSHLMRRQMRSIKHITQWKETARQQARDSDTIQCRVL